MVWEAVKLAEEMVSGAEEAVWDMDMGELGEALSGAAEAVVWVGCTMAQRSSNMGWGSCNISRGGICIWDWGGYSMCRGGGVYGWGGCDMGRRECIWALLWYSNEHVKQVGNNILYCMVS